MKTRRRSAAHGPAIEDVLSSTDGARQTSIEVVVAALEDDIVLGRLHPRERLVEDDLISRYGVSRHQVRQALMELDRIGLVERVPNRGAQVRSYSIDEVEELYELRDLLEGRAASLIDLPMAAFDLEELKFLQSQHDKAIFDSDLPAIFRANLAFHRKLFSFCRNRFLAEAITTAAQRAHGMRFHALTDPVNRDTARREHHAMIAAIADCDRNALVRLCRDHLPLSKQVYLRTFGGSQSLAGKTESGFPSRGKEVRGDE